MTAAALPGGMTPAPAPRSAAPARLVGDAGFAMGAKLFYLVTRLGLPPLILAHISLAEYGLWAACFVIVGYIGLADLGLSSVYVRYVARMNAAGDTHGISRTLCTGMLSIGAISCVLLIALYALLPAALDLLKIEPAARGTAAVLIMGTACVFLADMTLGGFAYLLHGMQRIRIEQRIWVAAFSLEMLLIVAFLHAGLGVVALLAAYALRYAFSLALTMRQAFRVLPALRLSFRLFDRSLLPGFLSFGLSVQASTMFSMLLHSADRVVAGLTLGPAAIALFDIGGKIPIAATSVPGAITHVTLPAAARIDAAAGTAAAKELADLCLCASRATSLASVLPMAFLAAFSVPLCRIWLGERPDLAVLPLIMALSAASAHLHIVTGPASAVFRSQGNVGNEFVYHGLRVTLIAAGIGVAVLCLGVTVTAIACGLAGGIAVAAVAYLAYSYRALGLPLRRLATRVLLPGLVPAMIALGGVAAWFAAVPATLTRWPALALLAAFGAVYVALSALAVWRLLDTGERAQLAPLLRRLKRSPAEEK